MWGVGVGDAGNGAGDGRGAGAARRPRAHPLCKPPLILTLQPEPASNGHVDKGRGHAVKERRRRRRAVPVRRVPAGCEHLARAPSLNRRAAYGVGDDADGHWRLIGAQIRQRRGEVVCQCRESVERIGACGIERRCDILPRPHRRRGHRRRPGGLSPIYLAAHATVLEEANVGVASCADGSHGLVVLKREMHAQCHVRLTGCVEDVAKCNTLSNYGHAVTRAISGAVGYKCKVSASRLWRQQSLPRHRLGYCAVPETASHLALGLKVWATWASGQAVATHVELRLRARNGV